MIAAVFLSRWLLSTALTSMVYFQSSRAFPAAASSNDTTLAEKFPIPETPFVLDSTRPGRSLVQADIIRCIDQLLQLCATKPPEELVRIGESFSLNDVQFDVLRNSHLTVLTYHVLVQATEGLRTWIQQGGHNYRVNVRILDTRIQPPANVIGIFGIAGKEDASNFAFPVTDDEAVTKTGQGYASS